MLATVEYQLTSDTFYSNVFAVNETSLTITEQIQEAVESTSTAAREIVVTGKSFELSIPATQGDVNNVAKTLGYKDSDVSAGDITATMNEILVQTKYNVQIAGAYYDRTGTLVPVFIRLTNVIFTVSFSQAFSPDNTIAYIPVMIRSTDTTVQSFRVCYDSKYHMALRQLIAWWSFSETSGTTAFDNTLHGLDLTVTGADITTNNYAVFDGVNDDLTITDAASGGLLDFGTQDFSISFWCKPDNTSANYTLVIKSSSTPAAGFEIQSKLNNKLMLYIGDGVNSVVNQEIGQATYFSTTDWVHTTLTFDRTNGIVTNYRNGVIHPTTLSISTVTGSISNTNNFRLGINNIGFQDFPGDLDEVMVHNKLLRADEVSAIYAIGHD